MPQLKLKVKKAGSKHPVTKQLGFAARVLTNGTMEFDDIVKDAGRNTTTWRAPSRAPSWSGPRPATKRRKMRMVAARPVAVTTTAARAASHLVAAAITAAAPDLSLEEIKRRK